MESKKSLVGYKTSKENNLRYFYEVKQNYIKAYFLNFFLYLQVDAISYNEVFERNFI